VKVLENADIEYALLHVTSMYPTPYEQVRLDAIQELKKKFSNVVIGLSDHSYGNYTCFAAVTLGASILEKHFTSDKNWDGPDIPISIDPTELRDLIVGSNAVHQALGGSKSILDGERKTAEFAYASVVTIKDIKKGEIFSEDNIWVKRPGTGEITVEHYYDILNKKATTDIQKNSQLKWSLIEKK
jgi:N-acetylneuraminate synthase